MNRNQTAAGAGISRAEFLKLMGWAGVLMAAGPGTPATAAPAGRILTRPIPRTAEPLPVIGLGTWQTFDIGDDPQERKQRREVLDVLFDGGGKVVDSSPMYRRAEAVVGDLLAAMGRRSDAFIATKVWTTSRESGIRQMQASAAKLKAPVIDLMQVHNLKDVDTHLETLKAWKAEGRVRYVGITHYTSSAIPELMQVMQKHPVDFVQMAYAIGVRDVEDRLLPMAQDKGIGVIVNRPFEGGDMFGRVRGKPLPGWAAEFDCGSWAQFFLKFIVAHPAVTCVIPGTSKPRYMADNLGAGRGRLPDPAQRRKMAEFWDKSW
jgi:aryl-alcohol dehydrogenase-like predicted oxidoreductase